MLTEIKCDKFVNQPIIKFHNGLNCILGDDDGSNSIGKSTSLMIIDFVFGGDTYSKNIDVRNNVGNHRIEFKFSFGNTIYSFYRDFGTPTIIYCVNDNRRMQDEEYRQWLKQMYNLSFLPLSFRNAVSVYSRIYGKNIIDEKQPLQLVARENVEKSILRLIQLFDRYSILEELNDRIKVSKEKYESYKKVQEYNLIANINAKIYKNNINKIRELDKELDELTNNSEDNSLDLDSFKLEQTKLLEIQKSKLSRHKAVEKVAITKLKNNLNEINVLDRLDENELISFFPNINLDRLRNIQQFHSVLKTNLKSEILNFISERETVLMALDNEIKELSAKISEITNQNQSLNKLVLTKLIGIQREIDFLQQQNSEYDKLKELKEKFKLIKIQYSDAFMEVAKTIENTINTQIYHICNKINNNQNSVTIDFKNINKYVFETYGDNGTGTNYKGLIAFDLSILELTSLPFIIHDSIMFKHIEDYTIEKVLEIYEQSQKQIFIAFDKVSSYTDASINILNRNRVMSLSANEKALFGRCWNNK